jgi:dihydrolipoamide dehydrogenase
MEIFDLVIIGGGPAGYPLAAEAAKIFSKVAIVDKTEEIGGTCLNWGCIPTKALLASAKNFHLLKNAEKYGLAAGDLSFDWEKIQIRKNRIVEQLRNGIKKMLEKKGVRFFDGIAKLCSGKIVKINNGETELKAEKVVLATGSVPAVPGFVPDDKNLFWTSDQALNAEKIPETLLVVGGGVIGLELGQVFNEFSSKVTIVEMMPQILPGLDKTTAKRLVPVFKKHGLELLTGKKVEKLTVDKGKVLATIDGSDRIFDKALIAAGRKANLSFLQDTGVEIELENGYLKTDKNYQTSIPDVFAIGDAIKGPMLAHKATYDAVILAKKWAGEDIMPDYSLVPSCVYTFPEIAWAGPSEDELKNKGTEYKTGRSLFSANGKALTAGEAEGQVKTLFDNDGNLLSTIIWGPEASNLISEGTMMAEFSIKQNDFFKMIHPHPTLSEAFAESVLNAFGQGLHG